MAGLNKHLTERAERAGEGVQNPGYLPFQKVLTLGEGLSQHPSLLVIFHLYLSPHLELPTGTGSSDPQGHGLCV